MQPLLSTVQEEREKLHNLTLEYLENKSTVFDKIEKSLDIQKFVSKNAYKKFNKFRDLAEGRINNLSTPKLKYFLQETLRLLNGPKHINIYRVNFKDKQGSPYIYGMADVRKTKNPPLVDMLVDTGSDICLISEDMLEDMGVDTNQIQPSISYSIQSSSDLVKNATVGKIIIAMHLVSRSGALVRTRIPFIVAHKKMELNKIILGDTFLSKQNISIQYRAPHRPKIYGEFNTNAGPRKIQLRVKGDTINCTLKINST